MGWLWVHVIVHVMISHSHKESGPCVSSIILFQAKHALILLINGFKGNAIDCSSILFQWWLFRVNRGRTARSRVLQVSKVIEWVSFTFLVFLCCLMVVHWIVWLIYLLMWTQGPPGDRGERGEPGDPGYTVSEMEVIIVILFSHQTWCDSMS